MATIAVSRVKREFKEVINSEEALSCKIKLELVDDTFTHLRGEIAGNWCSEHDTLRAARRRNRPKQT
jgi:hypothetical protein